LIENIFKNYHSRWFITIFPAGPAMIQIRSYWMLPHIKFRINAGREESTKFAIGEKTEFLSRKIIQQMTSLNLAIGNKKAVCKPIYCNKLYKRPKNSPARAQSSDTRQCRNSISNRDLLRKLYFSQKNQKQRYISCPEQMG